MPRNAKRIVVILVDAALAFIAVWLAFYLRLGEWRYLSGNQWLTVAVALSALPLFWLFGLYRAIFRHVGFDTIVGLTRANFVYSLIFASVFTFLGIADVPRTVGLIQPILMFMLVAASRVCLRILLGRVSFRGRESRVLVYGAGESGRQLARAIVGSGQMRLVGFVDDNPALRGALLNGKPIYDFDGLSRVVERKDVTDILLALPSATRKRRNEIVESLRPLAVNVRTVPGLIDLASGKVEVSSLRPLDIEDLLGRDPALPDPLLFGKNIHDKVVLVTGAGGSIGSEICRQIVDAGAATLVLVELSEYALYSIERELLRRPGSDGVRIIPLLASVRDERRLGDIMRAWRPDTVYHAAAYKHVPLVEHNPSEGILNNAMGTYITARAAVAAGVSDFVLISTDKAVRPTNIMGASKRLAELSLQALAASNVPTRLSMVRFGNVLGSSGSVVPLFRSQISRGGPVTITHPDVTRYFMTIPEAAQLVIQAGAMARGGEVFILDMGEPVKISELARKMIELSGLSARDEGDPDGDIAIEVIGLRPGEKLYEELLIGSNPVATAHPLIMKARETFVALDEFDGVLSRIANAIDRGNIPEIYDFLREAVPEFTADERVVDLLNARTAITSNEGSAKRRDKSSVPGADDAGNCLAATKLWE